MNHQDWNLFSFVDAVKPDPGWSVTCALFASYSLNPVVMAAVMLGLNGSADDRGSGNRVDFVDAFSKFKESVRFIVQKGRITWSSRDPSILALTDQYIKEVDTDEREASWHPKIGFIRMQSQADPGTFQWVLVLGSRNLTRDISLDAGLALIGTPGNGGTAISGVDDAFRKMAEKADLTAVNVNSLLRELRKIRWQCPAGVQVEEIRLFLPGEKRDLPTPPENIRALWAASPFLNKTTVVQLGTWGGPNIHRYLLSTGPALAQITRRDAKPPKGFKTLLAMGTPDTAEPPSEADDLGSEDAAIEPPGLHAKLIYAQQAGGGVLWMGSANITERGWKGANAEVVARLKITDADVASGLLSIFEGAREVDPSELAALGEEDPVLLRLEKARCETAAEWSVIQKRLAGGTRLVSEGPSPHPADPEILLAVGPLSGDLVDWPRDSKEVVLPAPADAVESDWVQVRLSLGDESCAWLQKAPLSPPPDEDRDRRAIADYLGPENFLSWMRSLITMTPGNGGGDWKEPPDKPKKGKDRKNKGFSVDAPTLEEMLRAWSRNPEQLQYMDAHVNRYLDYLMKDKRSEAEDVRSALADFKAAWALIQKELIGRKTR